MMPGGSAGLRMESVTLTLSADTADPDQDAAEVLEVAKVRLQQMASSLGATSAFLEVIALILAAVGVVGGIALAAKTKAGITGQITRPNVATGVAVVVASMVAGALYWVVFRALRLFSEYVIFKAETDTENHHNSWQGESARSKECPDCFEDVWVEARVCAFCHHRFTSGCVQT